MFSSAPFFLNCVFIQTKERYKLEALKKKQEQEIERMKKIEEEKKKKQDELKRLAATNICVCARMHTFVVHKSTRIHTKKEKRLCF